MGEARSYRAQLSSFALTIKNLFGLALLQTTGFVQSLLTLSGLHWPVPDLSTLCRRQRSLDVQVLNQSSSGGLQLLVDSTGIKFLGESEWKCKKHGAERRRQWRKLYIGIDAQSVQVRRRLGRKIWKCWSGYHRRSLVETKMYCMYCIKRLGERVISRTFERQVNELHIRAAILNRFTVLGHPQTVAMA